MNVPRHPSRQARPLLRAAVAISGCAAFLLLSPSAEAGGFFAKLKEKKRKKAQVAAVTPKWKTPRPFSPPRPSAPRAVPTGPPSPANYLPDPPASGDPLAPVARTRPGQLRIFVLADSQGLLPFGEELQRGLVEQGHEVLMHAVKNGTPYFWSGLWPSPVLTRVFEPASSPDQCGRWRERSLQPRSVTAYVESYDPDVFVFQAGTNFEEDLASGHPGVARMMEESLREARARGARVLWIGPPDARDDVKSVEFQDRATTALRAAIAPVSASQDLDSFFDSRPACPIPNDLGGDGEHPSNPAGREWGRAAAAWVGAAVAVWKEKGLLRPPDGASPGASPGSPASRLFTRRLQETPLDESKLLDLELELLAKSEIGDLSRLEYTDAFSVYRYRVLHAAAMRPQLEALGVAFEPASGEAVLQVLHWTAHNDGTGPRATRSAARRPGEVVDLRLCPIGDHPLGDALGTMPRFDDFNDFAAPLFVAADLLAERTY